MISLNILLDFCSYWWLWWILPFLLGWLFGRSLMAKWKRLYEEKDDELRKLKKSYKGLEGNLQECEKSKHGLRSDLALQKGRIEEVERELERRNTEDKTSIATNPAAAAPVVSSLAGVTPLPVEKVEESKPAPASSTSKPSNPGKYAKLKPDNLQIIEGIGPKMESVLKENCITSWTNLASQSNEDLQAILNKYGDIDDEGQYFSTIKNPSKRFFTMLGALVAGRISVGIGGNTGAKSALAIAIKYALKRRQFAPKDNEAETLIMDYPSHQRRLIPRLAKTYALNFALHDLQEFYSKEYGSGDMREVETLAAGLKAYATWHATDVIQECREACGGKGYLQENRIPDIKADTDIFTTFEGDNTVLMQLVAKSLMSEYRDNFNDGGYMAIIRFLAGRFTTSVTELNPITIRNTNAEHLLDEDFHRSAFDYRAQKLTITVGQRMRNYLKRRITPYQAYLRCQNHMEVMAEAYIEKIILEKFYQIIEQVEDEDCARILRKLCQLFALDTIQKNKGWYLENDYVSSNKTKAIRRVINKLIQELRPEVLNLVQSFNIPDELLGAKIVS